MSTRVVSACLMTALVFAAPFTLAGAKPPDLPVNDEIDCRDSGPQPVPITVSAPTPVRAAARVAPPGVLPSAPPPVPITAAAPPAVRVAVPATPCAPCPAAAKMVTKVYPVADLVIPLEKGHEGKTTEDQLMKLITSAVAPSSWTAKGGAGTMDYYPLTLSLAVNQPPDIQKQIADLLASLRQSQDVCVAAEVRFISVSEDFCEKIGLAEKKSETKCDVKTCPASVKCGAAKADSSGVRFLNDAQLYQLMEAVQADERTSILQAPKITTLNGQPATIEVGQQQIFVTGMNISLEDGQPVFTPKTEVMVSGLNMSLQPVVSMDKRFVRLSVDAKQTTLDSDDVPLVPVTMPIAPILQDGAKGEPVPITQFLQQPKFTTLSVDKTLTIPDGGSALLNMGKREHQVGGGFRPPVLRAIPYVKRLFSVPAHMETEHVLMVVTPRIIVEEAEETHVARVDQPKSSANVMPPADAEEQEEPPCIPKKCPACCEKCSQCCQKKCQDCCEKCTSCCQKVFQASCEKCPLCCQNKAAEFVEKYQRACSEGHGDEATRLAIQALAIDPMCFSKLRTVPGGNER